MTRSAQLRRLYLATFAHFGVVGLFVAGIQLYLATELDASEVAVGVAVAIYAVAAVTLRPLVGRAMDRKGRRWFIRGALALLAVSSAGFIFASAVGSVLVLRFAQGAAGAAFYTTAAAIVLDLAPDSSRAREVSRFSLFLYAGLAVGPTLAETVISNLGFDALWVIAAVTSALGLAAVWRLPETAELGLPPMFRRRGRYRFIHPAAVMPGFIVLSAAVGYGAIIGFSALYANSIGMASSGVLYMAFAATVIVVRIAAGGLSDRLGHRAVSRPALVLAAGGLGLLAVWPVPVAAIAGVMAFGSGFALLFPSLLAFLAGRISERERGEAVASFTAFMDIGIGGGGYLVGSLAHHFGFGAAYAMAAGLCLVGLVLAWRLPAESPTIELQH